MASLRKSASYSKARDRPYTRKSKRRQKSYIKTVPNQSIVKFNMGKQNLFKEGKLPYQLRLVSTEKVQIRANALEACRQYLNKKMEKNFAGQFFFKIIKYPHHIQRENKMLTGAGADRMQTGMQLSFGKTIARATFVNPGETIFFIATANKKAESFAREHLKVIKSKLPCKTRIESEVVESKSD